MSDLSDFKRRVHEPLENAHRAQALYIQKLEAVVKDMLSVTPEITEADSKLEDIALELDAYDLQAGVVGQTEMQDELRKWARELRAALASLSSEEPKQ